MEKELFHQCVCFLVFMYVLYKKTGYDQFSCCSTLECGITDRTSGYRDYKAPKNCRETVFHRSCGIGAVNVFPYAQALKSNIFSSHTIEINEWERFVTANTKENETILIDSACYESIYLPYKGRYAANRLPYFLPWYMDWYQDDTIQDIKEKQPKFILYNPQLEVWEITNFMEPLQHQVDKDYVLDKKSGIYIRK